MAPRPSLIDQALSGRRSLIDQALFDEEEAKRRAQGFSFDPAKSDDLTTGAERFDGTEKGRFDYEGQGALGSVQKRIDTRDNARSNLRSAEQTVKLNEAIDEGKPDWVTRTLDVLRSVPSGAIEGVGSGLSGVSQLQEIAERRLAELRMGIAERIAGKDIAVAIEKARPNDPTFSLIGAARGIAGETLKDAGQAIGVPQERETDLTNIAEGLGQISSQIAVALATGGTGSVPMLLGQGADQMGETVKRTGNQGNWKGDLATIGGAAVTAALEKTGLDALLDRVPPNVRNSVLRRIVDYSVGGGVEAATEVAEGISQDVLGKLLLDPNIKIGEGIIQDFKVGGAVGVLGRALVDGVGGKNRALDGQFRKPVAPGRIEQANVDSDPTPEDMASPLAAVVDIGKAKTLLQGATAKVEADNILTKNNAPPTGTMVEFMGQRWTVEDAFTDESGEDGVTLTIDGRKQKVYFQDLADAGETLAPIADPRTRAENAPVEVLNAVSPTTKFSPPAQSPEPVSGRDTLKARIRRVESGGKDQAKNPLSSASGRYQFTKGTWEALGGDWDNRFDPGEQERLMDVLTERNETALEKAGFQPTAGHLYLAHFAGSGGALKLLRNPRGSAEVLLGKAVINANPFLKGMTGAEVAAWADKKMGSNPSELGAKPSELGIARFADGTAAEPETDDEFDFLNSNLLPERASAEIAPPPAEALRPSLTEQMAAPSIGMPIDPAKAVEIDQAAAIVAEPTEAQKEAGNYRKGHVKVAGLDITIETPRGATRSGTDPNGQAWSVEMPDHYGYVKRSTGADGEQVDVYIGPNPAAETVFVVDQNDADTRAFDEHKAMLGFDTEEEALASYRRAFSDGRADERIGAVTAMPVGEFREWLKSEQRAPAAEAPINDGTTEGTSPINPESAVVSPSADTSVIPSAEVETGGSGSVPAPDFSEQATFDPTPLVPQLREYVSKTKGSLQLPVVAKALGVSEEEAGRVIGALAAQPGAPIRVTRGRPERRNKLGKVISAAVPSGIQRAPMRRGPIDVLTFVQDKGGVRDDEGHDLARGMNLSRRPGVIRKNGRSVDEMGELLTEAGYFTERPTEAEVLELLDRANHRKVYRPEEQAEAEAATSAREMDAEEARARADLMELAEDWGLTLSETDLEAALGYRAEGETLEVAIGRATDEAAAASLNWLEDDTGKAYYDTPEGVFEGDLPEQRGEPQDDAGSQDRSDREAPQGVAGSGRIEGGESRGGTSAAEPARDESARQGEGAQSRVGNLEEGSLGLDADQAGKSPEAERQRAEIGARQQQGMARRGGQTGLKDQEGGLFSAERDQDQLFSRPEEPVTRLTGGELQVPSELKGIDRFRALRKAARDWYRANLFGREVVTTDGKTVRFNETGLDKSTARKGEDLLKAVPAILSIVQRGTLVYTGPGDRLNVRRVHFYAAPVEIAGKVQTLGVHVREMTNGIFQYNLTFDQGEAAGRRGIPGGDDAKTSFAPAMEGAPGNFNLFLLDEQFNTGAESAPDGDAERLADELREQLKARGIADKVMLRTTDLLFENPRVAGRYHRQVIDVALKSVQEPSFTLNHEVVHALRDLDLFRPAEWSALVKAAKSDAKLMASIGRRYGDLNEEAQLEEAISDMFAAWVGGQEQRGFIHSAFQRVLDFLKALGEFFRGNGFADADAVMRAIERGDVGRRGEAAETEGEEKFSLARTADDLEAAGAASPPLTSLIGRFGGEGRGEGFNDAFDRWRTALQDKMLPLLRTQQKIERALGRPLSEEENPYLGEELSSGKVGGQLEQLSDRLVNPLFEAMKAEGISAGELESYLYARHAPERNKRIAEINPEFAEGTGSGMTDLEAKAIVGRIKKAGRLEAFDRVAGRVDQILRFAVETRIEAGLLSQEEADAWRSTYEHYVPLRGLAEMDENGDAPRRGSGINVRGKESQRAFGRRSKAEDILAYSILQAEEAIVRAETNRVAQQFHALAKAAPDREFWTIDKITRKPLFSEATGLVSYRNESRVAAEDAPYTVSLKIDGEEHRVTLNRNNPAAVRLADAMRNLSGQQFHWMVGFLGKFTRAFSAINTRYSPPFVIVNAIRDLQTASVNLQQQDIPGLVKGVMRDWRKALLAPKDGSGEWAKWRREFELAGGKVYFNDLGDIDQLRKRIDREISKGSNRTTVSSIAGKFFDVVDSVNDRVENAIRLAAYKNAREAGVDKAKAASIARNATVNFTRRGKFGPVINAGYAFFNAATQGSATLIFAAIKSGKVRRTLAGLVVLGFAMDMLNGLAGDDDEDGDSFWAKLPEHEKERNIVLMLPGSGGKYLKLPLGLGLNAFFNFGRNLSAAARGEQTIVEALANSASAITEAFNPLGGGGTLTNLILPTILDPLPEIETNRNFAGKPIQPDQSPYDPEVAPSANYFPNVNPIAKALTDAMNSATGGDDVMPGAASVSPEVVEYLFGYFTGGAGRFIGDTAKLAMAPFDPEAEMTIQDVPFANRVFGQKSPWYDKSAFYARLEEIETEVKRGKTYIEQGDQKGLDRLIESRREVLELEPLLKAARKQMRKIRKERGGLELALDKGELDQSTYREDSAILDEAEAALIANFNARYLEAVERPARP